MGKERAKKKAIIFQLNPLASFSIHKNTKQGALKIQREPHIKKIKEIKEKTRKREKQNTEKENSRSRRKHQRNTRTYYVHKIKDDKRNK